MAAWNDLREDPSSFVNHPIYDSYWKHLDQIQNSFQQLINPFKEQENRNERHDHRSGKKKTSRKPKQKSRYPKMPSCASKDNTRQFWGIKNEEPELNSEEEKEFEAFAEMVRETDRFREERDSNLPVYYDPTYELLSNYCHMTAKEESEKDKQMTELYGKAAGKIKSLETPMISLFHSYHCEQKLPLWPAIPLKL